MSVARHPRPPELVGVPIEDIMQKFVGRFREKKPDWAAFEDAKIEGYKRAQHRFIGAGGSGKTSDPTIIPASNFTLSLLTHNTDTGHAALTPDTSTAAWPRFFFRSCSVAPSRKPWATRMRTSTSAGTLTSRPSAP